MTNPDQVPRSPQPRNGEKPPKEEFHDATKEFRNRMRAVQSKEVFQDPSLWPKRTRPFLCVKNEKLGDWRLPKPGLLYEKPEHRLTVFDVNMYDIPIFGGRRAPIKSEEEFLATAYKTYASIDEMIEDGWVLDDWVLE